MPRFGFFDKVLVSLYVRGKIEPRYLHRIVEKIVHELDDANIAGKPKIHFKPLVIGHFNRQELSALDYFRILRYIISVRGLTRFLSKNLLSNDIPELSKSYEYSRWRLLTLILKSRSIVKRAIRDSLRLDSSFTADLPLTTNLYLDSYVLDNVGITDFRDGSILCWPEFGSGSVNVANSNKSYLRKILKWDMKSTLIILYDLGLSKIAANIFNQNSPHVAHMLKEFTRLKFSLHPQANTIFDELDPDASMYLVENVEIWHQRFIVRNEELLVIDGATDVNLPFVAGHWQFLQQKSRKTDGILMRTPHSGMIFLEEGFLLSGRADENWYHFLLDTLPKVLFLQKLPERVPLLIRSDIPETTKDFLSKLTSRRLIEIPVGTKVFVKRLSCLPVRSTCLDSESNEKNVPKIEFSPRTIKRLVNLITESQKNQNMDFGIDRVYFKRQAKYRRVLNSTKLEALSRDYGFEIISPDVSFYRNQVAHFAAASVVISPGGALLANMIFLSKGARVICLHSWRGRKVRLWQQLASAQNIEMINIFGVPTYFGRNSLQNEHSNYYVPLWKFRRTLESLRVSRTSST